MSPRYLTSLHKELGFPPLPGGGGLGGSPYSRFILLGVFGTIGITVGLAIGPELPPKLGILFGINLTSFLLCGYDKAIAGSGSTRIPEKVLLLFALCGGSIGLLAAMFLFRHKTRKHAFIFLLFLIFTIQLQVMRATGLGDAIMTEWEVLVDGQ